MNRQEKSTRVETFVLSSRILKSLTTMCIYQSCPYNWARYDFIFSWSTNVGVKKRKGRSTNDSTDKSIEQKSLNNQAQTRVEGNVPLVWNVYVLGELGKAWMKESKETKNQKKIILTEKTQYIEQVYILQSSNYKQLERIC